MHELLVREAYRGKLLGHFGVVKTLDVFHKHLSRIYDKCITCRKQSLGLNHMACIPLCLNHG